MQVADTSGAHLELEYTYASDVTHNTTVVKRWNMLKADMEALVATYNVPVDGRTVNIQVNRNDDCTFDVTITTTLTSGGLDIDYTVGTNCDHLQSTSLRWDLTEAEALAFAGLYESQTEGVTKSVSISRNSDNTFNVSASSTSASSSELVIPDFGAREDSSIEYKFEYSLSETELQALMATYAVRVHGHVRQLQTFRNPDCTYNIILIDRYKDQDSRIDFTTSFKTDLDSTATVLNVWNLWDQDAVDQYIIDKALDQQVEGLSHTVNVTRNEDGTFDVSARLIDHRNESDDFTTITGKNSTDVETTVYKWHQTKAEADIFQALYVLPEEGKLKSVQINRQTDGMYSVVGRTTETGVNVTIDFTYGREIDVQTRVISTWGLSDQAEVNTFVASLNAQIEGTVRNVQVFRNGNGTYNMTATIGDNNNPFTYSYTHSENFDVRVESIYAYNLEDEAAVDAFVAANATTTPRKSVRQLRHSRAGDGTYNIAIITRVSGINTITLQVDHLHDGCDAQQVSFTMYHRDENEPAEPTLPEGSWHLADKRATQLQDGSVNWTYTYAKYGTEEFRVITVEAGAEAEQRVVLMLNRDGTQVEPSFAGYSLSQTRVEERGQCLADYRYFFTKDGTVQHEMENVFPGQDAEQKTITLLNRTSDPGVPAVAGFVVVRQSKRERGGIHTDYIYIMLKIPGSTYTVSRRKMSNGELMIQKVHMRQTDMDVLNYWADDGTGKVINVQYQASSAGQGFVDIMQTIVHPFGYDGSTVIASKSWVDVSRPYEQGSTWHNKAYRYWYTKYRHVVETTVRTQLASPAAVADASHSLYYQYQGSSDSSIAHHPVGDTQHRQLVSSPYGFWYLDVTTTTYSNSGLFTHGTGTPNKTIGKTYASSLI